MLCVNGVDDKTVHCCTIPVGEVKQVRVGAESGDVTEASDNWVFTEKAGVRSSTVASMGSF